MRMAAAGIAMGLAFSAEETRKEKETSRRQIRETG